MEWFLAVLTLFITLLTSLGYFKYFVEPGNIARMVRRKYATALWIECYELQIHLKEIEISLQKKDGTVQNPLVQDALKKIPNNDYNGRIDWFTKWGYYTTITAYKIASVSAWTRIYQKDLLLSAYSEKDRKFISQFYQKTDKLKKAFSQETILWYYYIDSIGDKLINEGPNIYSPISSFASFCEKCSLNTEYRLFFEQLHMFLWFVADGKYLSRISEINEALMDMKKFLEGETEEKTLLKRLIEGMLKRLIRETEEETLLKGLKIERSYTGTQTDLPQ